MAEQQKQGQPQPVYSGIQSREPQKSRGIEWLQMLILCQWMTHLGSDQQFHPGLPGSTATCYAHWAEGQAGVGTYGVSPARGDSRGQWTHPLLWRRCRSPTFLEAPPSLILEENALQNSERGK